jgi:Transposase DDE domain group 1
MKRGLQSLAFSFEAECLTHYGGLFLIQRFCNKLDFRRRLQRVLRAAPEWTEFDPVDLILLLLCLLIVGVQRVNKSDKLQYDGFFLALLGLEKLPDESTLRRFLQRLSPDAIRQLARLHDQFRADLFSFPKPRSSLVFHLDSVVLTLYGKQQGARLGYNPKAKGRPSYHPILCFEGHGQEFWHGSLRPGDAGSNTGARHFVKRCLEKVPSSIARTRIRFLADAGFFSGALVNDLDQLGCGFTIVCRSYDAYKRMAEKAGFTDVKMGWGFAEFHHRPQKWRKERRFIAIRRPLPVDPEQVKQLTLFKDTKYSYSVLVTNLGLTPWRTWTDYIGRANIEKSIRELLNDLALSKIPTQSWTANVAFLQLLLLAYNLVHWFKRLCLPEDQLRTTVETLRHQLLGLPAKLICRSGKNVLILPRQYPHQAEFLAAEARVRKFKSLKSKS